MAGLTGVGLYEYLLVAYPDGAASEKIFKERQSFQKQYNQQEFTPTKPQIIIANFLAKEAMEETIIRYIERIYNRQQSFAVTLNNYSGIPPHTIYLRVQNKQPFAQLTKELNAVSSYIASCSCPPAKLTKNPHVLIAQTLPQKIYLPALLQYGQKSFYETFIVDELVLLKKMHNSYKPVNLFHLKTGLDGLFN
jgi:2'-5' RNA ligase